FFTLMFNLVINKLLPCLLCLRQAENPSLKAEVREGLTLVGYNNPVKGLGIRRLPPSRLSTGLYWKLLPLQCASLLAIILVTRPPLHCCFDGPQHLIALSAIPCFMLGVFQIQNVIVGTIKMGWSHFFCDSQTLEQILKKWALMVETSRNSKCPKLSFVTCTPLKAYVFREYNLQPTEPGVHSHYLGGYEHKMWQAVRASSAAMGHDLHQVRPGPALAIHECKCLWPNTSVQCVVSLGTGRVETAGKNNTTYTSLKTKLPNVITSATDTEEVHVMLDALLSPDLCLKLEKIKHGMYDGKPIFNCKL
uniref:Uncharacterized protein n=1 Tax=Oncorhynchus kisutch TaxID=8019 RepID=A0A8C7N5B5_ONCKI